MKSGSSSILAQLSHTADTAIIAKLKIAYDEYDYEQQVRNFIALGDYFCQKKNDPINATALYHFALAICSDAKKNEKFRAKIEDHQNIIKKNLANAERQLLASLGKETKSSDTQLTQTHQEHKDRLMAIRTWAENELKLVHEAGMPDPWVEIKSSSSVGGSAGDQKGGKETKGGEKLKPDLMQAVYREVSERLRDFVKGLILECKTALGNPPDQPCSYAIICFGSLARDEATPYSDLEFGVLLEEKVDTKKNKKYFRDLTRLLQLKVVNLGETTPRMQNLRVLEPLHLLDRYSKSPTKHGFCFDGQNKEGCKTPLGNVHLDDIPENEKYELIMTPSQMAELHNAAWFRRDRHMASALTTAQLLEGDKELLLKYKKAVADVLTCTTPAYRNYLQGLSKHTENIIPGEIEVIPEEKYAQQRVFEWLIEIVEEFNPRMGVYDDEGHFFNVKYDLYRLPCMVLDCLAVWFQIQAESTWDKIDQLHAKNLLSEKGAFNLKLAFSKISMIRLRNYLEQKEQDNRMTFVREDFSRTSTEEALLKQSGIKKEELFSIYYTLIPLYVGTRYFVVYKGAWVLSKAILYEASDAVKGDIYMRLHEHSKALDCLNQALEEESDPENLDIIRGNIGNLQQETGNYDAAIKNIKAALGIDDSDNSNPMNLDLFVKPIQMLNLAYAYYCNGDYEGAEKLASTVSEIYRVFKNKTGQVDAIFLLAMVHRQWATKHHQPGYKDPFVEKYFKAAEVNFKKSLKLAEDNFGKNSLAVGNIKLGLGLTYRLWGITKFYRHEITAGLNRAIDCYEEALKIFSTKLGSKHLDTMMVHNNMVVTYARFGELNIKLDRYQLRGERLKFNKIHSHHRDILECYKSIYGPDHPHVALCLNNAGAAYFYIKDDKKAIPFLVRALEINRKKLPPGHLYIQRTLSLLRRCGGKEEAQSSGKKEAKGKESKDLDAADPKASVKKGLPQEKKRSTSNLMFTPPKPGKDNKEGNMENVVCCLDYILGEQITAQYSKAKKAVWDSRSNSHTTIEMAGLAIQREKDCGWFRRRLARDGIAEEDIHFDILPTGFFKLRITNIGEILKLPQFKSNKVAKQ